MINNYDINGNTCVTLHCHKKNLHTLFVTVLQKSYFFIIDSVIFVSEKKEVRYSKEMQCIFPPIDRNFQNIYWNLSK